MTGKDMKVAGRTRDKCTNSRFALTYKQEESNHSMLIPYIKHIYIYNHVYTVSAYSTTVMNQLEVNEKVQKGANLNHQIFCS